MQQTQLALNFTLLRGGEVYTPEALGIQDILICNDKIVAIAPQLDVSQLPNCQVVEMQDYQLCPGLIDQHVHLIGGGGEAGPHTRTPEVRLSALIESGITTVIGLLGTDSLTRHPESLLAKTQALNNEGITAYMLTGAYTVPTPTITGQIDKDIAFIDRVIGVKTAISDHRSSAPTADQLANMAAQARVGGLLGSKAGITVFHMGNSDRTLAPIYAILEQADVPINKLLPTHVNRAQPLFDHAIEFALHGGYIDITSGISPEIGARSAIKPSRAIKLALERGVPLAQLTMSSDGNGSQPNFDANGKLIGIGVAGFTSLWQETRDLVQQEGLSLSEALAPVTKNVAQLLQLDKGELRIGYDADILIIDHQLNIQQLYAKGQRVVNAGQALIKGTFE